MWVTRLKDTWSMMGPAKRLAVQAGSIVVLLAIIAALAAAAYWIYKRYSKSKHDKPSDKPDKHIGGSDKQSSGKSADPKAACIPSGRFQIPTYSDGGDKLPTTLTTCKSATVNVDFANTCGAKSVSWQYASGLRGQPSTTSDYSEFAVVFNKKGRTHRTVLDPSILKGSGWVRVIATYDDENDLLLVQPMQLPPLFSESQFNMTYQ